MKKTKLFGISQAPSSKMIKKPWGTEILWALTHLYAGKLLVIDKGHRLSLQYHSIKHETIYTLKGRWRLVLENKTLINDPGAVVVIPPNTNHRFEAPYEQVVLIEVSTPEIEDVVRVEDDYGRSGQEEEHHG